MTAAEHHRYSHFLALAVRWGEQDALGHVNNTVFYRYSEDGRLDYFHRMLDAPLAAGGNGPILADLRCRFFQQLTFPAEIEIATRVARIGNSSLTMLQALFHVGDEQAIAAYESIVVWFDYGAQASARVPDAVRERIRDTEKACPPEA